MILSTCACDTNEIIYISDQSPKHLNPFIVKFCILLFFSWILSSLLHVGFRAHWDSFSVTPSLHVTTSRPPRRNVSTNRVHGSLTKPPPDSYIKPGIINHACFSLPILRTTEVFKDGVFIYINQHHPCFLVSILFTILKCIPPFFFRKETIFNHLYGRNNNTHFLWWHRLTTWK